MPYAELDETGERVVIATEYRDGELIKIVPGLRWSNLERVWWGPVTWATCVQLRGVFGSELQVGPRLGQWSRDEIATRIAPCMQLRTAEDSEQLAALFTKLKPFQRAGAHFLAAARQALLADEMGLGKTVQTIAALEVLGDGAYPALIICPNSMKLTWAEEFQRWAPGRFTTVIDGSLAEKKKRIEEVREGAADVAIVNFESLAPRGGKGGLTRLARYGSHELDAADKEPKELNSVPWVSVIADEAHRALDPKAKQTRALWWLGDCAHIRFALTGTPVSKSPADLWPLMRFVSPAEFPAKTKFIDRYALQAWSNFGFMDVVGFKPETSEELFKIVEPRMIRRLKVAVMPQLPDKVYSKRYVVMGAKQRKAYEQLRKEMIAQLDSGALMATNPLAQMTRLVQFSAAYGELVANGSLGADEQPLFDLKLIDPSCKVDGLEEVTEELGDQQAIVFAESRQLLEIAVARYVKKGTPLGQVSGAVPMHQRQAHIQAFKENKTRLLFIQIGAGAEGLSFPGCSTEIFLQRSMSAIKNAQAEDRIHGIGRGVEGTASTIIDIITADSAEARVHDLLLDKAVALEQVVRDEATVRAWLAKAAKEGV